MRTSQSPNGPVGLGHLARAWLSSLLTGKRQAKPSGWGRDQGQSEQGQSRAKGFAEQGAWRPQADHSASRSGDFDAPITQADNTQPFASVGPQGHRERMREKLLSRGTDSLADYELLEMLLLFAFKRGDTKPLA